MQLESKTNKIRQNAGGFSLVNGPAWQQGRQPSLWSPSLPWRSSSAAGSVLRDNVAPGIVILNSSPPSRLPLSQGHPLPGSVQSVLRPQAQTFLPSRQPSGSGHLLAGQVCQVPTCHPQESCLPSSRFHSSLPLFRTMVSRDTQPTPATLSHRLTSEEGKQSSTPVVPRSPGVPASLSSQTSGSVVLRQRARRSQTPVPVSAPALRSSSRTRFSNVPSGSDSEGGAKDIVLRSVRKTPTKKRTTAVYSDE